MARLVLKFSSSGLLETNEVTKVVNLITYCYDLAAIDVGAANFELDRLLEPRRIDDASPLPIAAPPRPEAGSVPGGLASTGKPPRVPDWIPENRPRWRPRLKESEDRLKVSKLQYGSPLELDLIGDPAAFGIFVAAVSAAVPATVASAGKVADLVEKLATMPSRIKASNATHSLEALKAEMEASALLDQQAAIDAHIRGEFDKATKIAGALEAIDIVDD